jgi:hypothetical protein
MKDLSRLLSDKGSWLTSVLSIQIPLKINIARFHRSYQERIWRIDFYLTFVIVFHNFKTMNYENLCSKSKMENKNEAQKCNIISRNFGLRRVSRYSGTDRERY